MADAGCAAIRFVVAGVVVAVVAACGKDSTAPRATPTAAETQQIGAQIADQAEQSLQLILPGDVTAPPFLSVRTANRLGGFALRRASLDVGSGCPTVTPAIPTDPDSDGVPNTLSLTYGACVDTVGSAVTSINGGISIADPTINVTDLNFDLSLNNVQFTIADSGITVALGTNGTFSATGSASGISQSLNLTVVASATGQGSAGFAEQWTTSFTPAQGQSLAKDQPLPAGNLSTAGSFTATHGGDSFAFSMQVVSPLVYDPACVNAASPFDSGELHANLTSGRAGGYVDIVWTNCQDPTVTFVAQGTL